MMKKDMGGYCFFTSLTILSLVLAAVSYLYSSPNTIIPTSTIFCGSRPSPNADYTDVLGVALRTAATSDKTVIITIVNKAYVEPHNGTYPSMLDLFLEGFWVGEGTRELVDHLLVVAVDQTAYDRCKFRKLNCYKLETDGVDFTGEKIYMSDEFIKMMWRRTLFLLDVLKRGYNFVFTDTDIIWLRSPFSRLPSTNRTLDSGDDMFISIDQPKTMRLNTGFYFIRPNNKTISLYETWYGMKDKSKGMKEQDVLDNLKKKGMFTKLGLRVKFLDTLYFNCFCTKTIDFHNVITMHANCCRSISAKVTDLVVVLRDWKRFKENTVLSKNSSIGGTMNILNHNYHYACDRSWK